MRPEQIARSITQSCSVTTIDASSHIVTQLQQFLQQNEFIRRYGDTGEDEFGNRGGTITQRLMLMNGKLAHEVPEFNPMVTNASSQISAVRARSREGRRSGVSDGAITSSRRVIESEYWTDRSLRSGARDRPPTKSKPSKTSTGR